MALRACNVAPERFSGLVLVDTGVRSPEEEEARDKDKQVPRLARPKIYPTQEVAMSRFRLQPPQQCENQYIVSHIARNSVEYDDEGWVWKFDEELNMRVKPIEGLKEDLVGLSINVALIYGELSESFSAQSAEHMKSLKPELEVIEMKDAQHHLFLDQPLDFISKLSGVLDRWGS
jgi:pimeloyl-ACP methyl ester carboxylesterase